MVSSHLVNGNKEQWIDDVRRLTDKVEQWCQDEKWFVERKEKTLDEKRIGVYSLPELFIRTDQGKLVVDPIGLDIVGGEGRVDIEAFPSMYRFLMIRRDRKWELYTDSLVKWPKPWNRNTFKEIIKELSKV